MFLRSITNENKDIVYILYNRLKFICKDNYYYKQAILIAETKGIILK